MSDRATPDQVARAARDSGCRSVAFTYNDPVVFAEFAIDTARACHEQGIKTVAVTAGYVSTQARHEFFEVIDAANVDLKAFTEEFYRTQCSAHLEPVKETLRYLVRETRLWLEVTTLLIPGRNDSPEEIDQLCDWFVRELGPDVPLHFSAFHPDFKMTDTPRTPASTCLRARDQALRHGLRYVYTGNLQHPDSETTYCPQCAAPVIERHGYLIEAYRLNGNRCSHCDAPLAGHFDDSPPHEAWGSRRMRVRLS